MRRDELINRDMASRERERGELEQRVDDVEIEAPRDLDR